MIFLVLVRSFFENMTENANSKIDNVNDQEQIGKLSDFSIDHILNRAGNSRVNESEQTVHQEKEFASNVQYQWLHCSRYCPPKIPRMGKRDVSRRQLGRHPRIPFTTRQLSLLEEKFKESAYLSSEEVTILSKKLGLADIRVKIWFQNRRARERREKSGSLNENKIKENDNNCSEESSNPNISRLVNEFAVYEGNKLETNTVKISELCEATLKNNPVVNRYLTSVPFILQNLSFVNKNDKPQ